nr:MAG TPA: hypothetical protein [Caudoviricetes sp.]
MFIHLDACTTLKRLSIRYNTNTSINNYLYNTQNHKKITSVKCYSTLPLSISPNTYPLIHNTYPQPPYTPPPKNIYKTLIHNSTQLLHNPI